jgi:dTDP-4-dehydrorhamnose reductase
MRLLLTGASGLLGGYLLRECRTRGDAVIAWSGQRRGELFGYTLHPVDLMDVDALATAFREARPEAIVHSAALTVVSDCYRDPVRAEQINTRGSAVLAELADRAKVRMIHVSTDMVFDGERGGYHEDDEVRPVSVYARTKAAAERAVLARARNLVVRVPLLFGPTLVGRPAFFDAQVAALREGRPIPLFHDEWRTPLSLRVAARALRALADADHAGLLHLGGPERLSRLDMGQRLATFLGCDPALLVPTSRTNFAAAEPRQRDLSLDSSRWRRLAPEQPWPMFDDALRELLSA